MYLVELKPGKEELYRTGDELALAIRDGDVDARSRIYHRATAKWISITLHPQYKAIVAAVQEEPVRPVRKAWGLLPAGINSVPVELSPTEGVTISGGIRQRWRRPIGLGAAGILLLLGIQLAFSGPRPPWAGQGRTVAVATDTTERAEAMEMAEGMGMELEEVEQRGESAETMVSLAGSTTAWPASQPAGADTVTASLPLPEVAPALPRAPRLRTKALRAALAPAKSTAPVNSVEALLSRYEAASHEAHDRLEGGMRVARLHRLFAPGRLTAGGGVTDTRRSLAAAGNFIRLYRQQQTTIDKVYQDSVKLLAKRHGWSPKEVKQWSSRQQRQENPTLELLSSSLLTGIDSVLGVLDAQAGAYKVRGTAIAFEDPAATQAYGALRRRIKEQIESAVAAGGATGFGPTGLLLQAIGTSTLPRET
ncbi:MAG: hypothetical protein H0T58_01975 [Gemmatimonadales bacterium]|nr:hypothetical protein [Gemmatimonadales bacterium]